MTEGPSRYEINRKVRQIFVSHNADMTKISYSCAHRTVYIYGTLVKDPKGDPVIVFNDLKYIGDNRVMYQHNLKGYLLEEVS